MEHAQVYATSSDVHEYRNLSVFCSYNYVINPRLRRVEIILRTAVISEVDILY